MPSAKGFGAEAKSELADISLDKDVDLNANAAKLDAAIAEARGKLDDLQAKRTDPRIDADITAVNARIREVRAKLDELGAKRSNPKVDADTAAAQAKLTQLTSKLNELNAKKSDPKVDVEIAAAEAKIQQLESKLDVLGAKRENVQVDADTARAQAQLEAVGAKADEVGRKRETIQVDSGGLPSIPPMLAAIVAGLAAIASAAGPAAAALAALPAALSGAAQGIGAIMAGFSGIGDAITAVTNQQQQAASSGSQAAQQQVQSARAIQSAQESLQQAQTQQARTAITGAQQVASAQRALAAAEVQADRARITGAQQVAAAERALAQAQLAAQRSVEDAEQAYTRSLRQEQYAQEALTQARKDAQRQLESLALQTSGAELSQEQATLDLKKAQQELSNAQLAGMPDGMQKDQLVLNVKQAQQAVAEAANSYKNLKEDSADAAKTGVEGSKQVVDAQRQLLAAQEATADSAKALSRAQVDGANQVKEAQIALAQAHQQAAWAQEDADRGVADAQIALQQAQQQAEWANEDAAKQVADAQRALSQAYQDAGTKGAASANKVEDALKKLSPAGREFVRFWTQEFQPAMKQISDAVAEAMLPKIETALRTVMNLFPTLKTGLAETGSVIGDVAIKAANLTNTPLFRTEIATIMASNNRALSSLGDAAVSLLDAFVKLSAAAGPLVERFATGAANAARMFDEFISGKARTGELQTWFQQMGDKLAVLWQAAKDTAKWAFDLFQKLQPLGDFLLSMLPTVRDVGTALADGLMATFRDMQPTLEALVKLIDLIAKGFSSLPPGIQANVGEFLLLIATVKLVSGPVMGMVGIFRNAMAGITALMETGSVVAALKGFAGKTSTAGAEAGKALETGFATGSAGTAGKAEAVGAGAGTAVNKGFLSKFAKVVGGLAVVAIGFEIVDALTGGAPNAAISAFVDYVNNAFTGEALSPATQATDAKFKQISDSVRRNLGLAKDYTSQGLVDVKNAVATGLIPIPPEVQAAGDQAVQRFEGALAAMPPAARTTGEGVKRATQEALNPGLGDITALSAQQATKRLTDNLFPGNGQDVRIKGQGLAGVLGQGLASLPPTAGAAGQGATGAMNGGLAGMPGGAAAAGGGAAAGLAGAINPMPGHAATTGGTATSNMLAGLNQMPGGAATAGNNTHTQLTNSTNPIPGSMSNAGTSAGNGFFTGLSNAWNAMISWLNSAISGLMSTLASVGRSVASTLGMASGAVAAPGPRGMAQGGMLAPMAEGGVIANAAGNGLTPMSGDSATMVPANTWRIIGDNMQYTELFAPLNGSLRTARLLAQAANHEGFALIPRDQIDGMVGGRMSPDTGDGTGGAVAMAVGGVISTADVLGAAGATASAQRYDTATQVIGKGTNTRATTAPAAASQPVLDYHPTVYAGSYSQTDELANAAYRARLMRRGGAYTT